jgi:hypothetical protein
MHFIGLNKRKWNVPALLAAGFLIIMFVEIGSHATLNCQRQAGSGGSSNWCEVLHQLYPSADCPHKNRPGSTQKNLLDETSHHTALVYSIEFFVKGAVYTPDSLTNENVSGLDRPNVPLFQPPKQT